MILKKRATIQDLTASEFYGFLYEHNRLGEYKRESNVRTKGRRQPQHITTLTPILYTQIVTVIIIEKYDYNNVILRTVNYLHTYSMSSPLQSLILLNLFRPFLYY